jgi:membrane protein implicated in regulation of membrane protease activity
MRGGAIPLLAWSALLALLLAGNWVWTGDAIQVAEFGFAVLAIALAGLTAILASRRRDHEAIRPGPPEPPAPDEVEVVPDLSVGAALAALAVAAILFGLAFGHFLVYFGAGLLALALGRLAVERRAQARTRERARPRPGAASAPEPPR